MLLLYYILIYGTAVFLISLLSWAVLIRIELLRSTTTYYPSRTARPQACGLAADPTQSLADLPLALGLAVLLAEDPCFYNHTGFDYKEISRRLKYFICGKGPRGSGSSISQQLMKFFYTYGEPSIIRKFKETILTKRLERHYKKKEILTLYLSSAPWGVEINGCVEASRHYFDKNPLNLTVGECALLAVLLRKPGTYGVQLLNRKLNSAIRLEAYHLIRNLYSALALYSDASYPHIATPLESETLETVLSRYHQSFASDVKDSALLREISLRAFEDMTSLFLDERPSV